MFGKEEDQKPRNEQAAQPVEHDKAGCKPVNCFAIGGGFLSYCVRQGWLIQESKGRKAKYYVTKDGREELKKFGISV